MRALLNIPIRARTAVALLGALTTVALGTLTVTAAGGKEDFGVAASPATQTVTKGQPATHTVSVTRVNGFAEPVALSVSGLPAGVTAGWKLSDGTGSNVVPRHLNSATLTLQTSAGTPSGTANLTINATGGKLTRSTPVTLVVEPPSQPGFALAASPVTRTVVSGDATSYALDVQRTGGFAGAVALAVSGLPKGATASWSPGPTIAASSSAATLTVTTEDNAKSGAHALTITGTAGSLQRSAAVTLVVDRGKAFTVTGDLDTALSPGAGAPLDLALGNPNDFPIRVQSLTVAIEEQTSRSGCTGTADFAITPAAESIFPLVLGAGQTLTLSQLGVPAAARPHVAMRGTAVNQDACKGATIHFDYGGTATK